MNTGDKYIFAADTPNGYQEIKRINNIIESCRPPYIDAETLRIRAEETWPQWKIDFYNGNIATTAHARKLQKNNNLISGENKTIDDTIREEIIACCEEDKLDCLGITVTNPDGSFKSIQQVLEELADIWNGLGTVNAHSLEEIRLGIEKAKE